MPQIVRNTHHEYRDSFGNGCCERLECGLERDNAIHHPLSDMNIVEAALDAWRGAGGGLPSDVARARQLAAKIRQENGLAV